MKKNFKNIILVLGIVLLIILNIKYNFIKTFFESYHSGFNIIFWSIILEAIPFILIGSLISSAINLFVSPDTIKKILPKNNLVAIIVAAFLGIIFPLCECAIIPITRRLIKKGVPHGVGITFMLATPIANVIVAYSTFYAFRGNAQIAVFRIFYGILTAILIGKIMSMIFGDNYDPLIDFDKDNKVKPTLTKTIKRGVQVKAIKKSEVEKPKKVTSNNLFLIFNHASGEFLNVLKYLSFGALISTFMQIFIPRNSLLSLGGGDVISIVIMMTFAFVVSLCSEADAFVARTFLNQFKVGGIVSFLIYGPMLDIKNLTMMLGTFKKKYVLTLVILITTVCFLVGLGLNLVIR